MSARFYRSILLAATAATTVFSAGSAMANSKSDFNGDGKADLVWRNQAADRIVVWYMNGATLIGTANMPATGNTNVIVAAVGDINADSKPDLIMRDTVTGGNVAWCTNGVDSTVFNGIALPTVSDLNWNLAAAGDFDLDGFNNDIAWRNPSNGTATNFWSLGSSGQLESSGFAIGANSDWYLGGVADFDKNGAQDWVWHNDVTGENLIWMRNPSSPLGSLTNKYLQSSAAALRPEAVADYTGDGCIDIVMRNSSTGANELWVYDCNINRVAVSPMSTVDLGWKIGVH
jgi:hypothetical protein